MQPDSSSSSATCEPRASCTAATQADRERQERRVHRWLFAGTLLAVAVALSPNLPDPDLWGHVEYARDAARFGLPATTTYSYTAQGYPWVNHELLAEYLQAAGMDSIGPIGMLIAKCLLGVGCIGLMMLQMRRQQASALTTCLVTLLVAVNLTYFWCVRPQLLTFICYTLLLTVLSYCFTGWQGTWQLPFPRQIAPTEPLGYSSRRMKFLWLVPAIIVVWTNSHGGFVAGIAIFAAYLGCRGLELISQRGWGESNALLHRFGLMIVAVLLVTFLNPYGPGLHTGLWRELGAPRPEIIEWRPPEFLTPYMLPFWLLLATWVVCLFASRRKPDFTHLMILTCTLEQSLVHRRHIPFFALAFGFWMAPHVESVLRRYGILKDDADPAPMSRSWQFAFAGTIGVAFLIGGAQLWNRLSDMPVPKNEYPVAAFQYVADRNLQGKMVVTFNWAQYALAAFGQKTPDEPGILLHADGRFRTCYPQELLDMHFDFAISDLEPRYRSPHSPPLDPTRVLEYGHPDLALVARGQSCSVNAMFRSQDRWTLLYQDQVAQVWGRSSRYADPASPDFIAPEQRTITNDPQTGSVTWPALPIRSSTAPTASHRMPAASHSARFQPAPTSSHGDRS